MESRHFVLRRDRLREHEIVSLPREPLAPGAVELSVDRFGFTANNITYGLLGDAMYWKFFPAPSPEWGCLPVWGFGTVVRSELAALPPGERFYGYFPMATHVVVHPARLDGVGFLDGAPHRRELSNAYNHYRRTTQDPNYRVETEGLQVILRPLFITSYVLADDLCEHGWFGADALLVTSASSKLAYGMAFVLAADPRRAGRELVGLTSPRNAAFVRGLGLYDRVVTYDEVPALVRTGRAALVDIAGSAEVRAAIHHRLGDALVRSIIVGMSHGVATDASAALPGPVPERFFAPALIQQRTKQWTPAGLQQRLAEAWNGFLVPLQDPTRGWLTIESATGEAAAARVYDEVAAGRATADRGYVLALAG
jgi:hypothetical protein